MRIILSLSACSYNTIKSIFAEAAKTMKRFNRSLAKRVTVLINTDNADHSRPVLTRFDFWVPQYNNDHKLLRFLSAVLRRNKIIFDSIDISSDFEFVRNSKVWDRRKIEGCISSSAYRASILEELYCT